MRWFPHWPPNDTNYLRREKKCAGNGQVRSKPKHLKYTILNKLIHLTLPEGSITKMKMSKIHLKTHVHEILLTKQLSPKLEAWFNIEQGIL